MRSVLAITASWLAVGCAPELGAPELDGVSPEWGYNGFTTDITISGRQFFPRVTATRTGAAEVDHQFSAWLEGSETVELEAVEFVDYDELGARVPAELTPGNYDLRVRSPSGTEATLADAFRVSDTRASDLRLSSYRTSFEVGEPALLVIELIDPNGRLVEAEDEQFEVEVEVQADEPDAIVFEETLGDQEQLGDSGVRGLLGLTGWGQVGLSSILPQDVKVIVSAASPSSSVASDSMNLEFTAGSPSSIRVTLPSTDYSAAAGDDFTVLVALVDGDGNVVTDQTANVLLYEECASENSVELDIFTTKSTPFTMHRATGTERCDEGVILARGVSSDLTQVTGASEPFEVLPGEPDALTLETSVTSAVAGESRIGLWVEAADAYENRVDDYDATLVLTDSAGGLDPSRGMGEQDCDGFAGGVALCDVWLWKVGNAVRITAESSDGLTGTSRPIDVVASSASTVSVTVEETQVTAGVVFPVAVLVKDYFGNEVDLDIGGGDAVSFTDDTGTLSCSYYGPEGAFSELFNCTTQKAGTTAVTADVVSRGVSGISDAFVVVNGEPDEVTFDLDGATSVTAGETIDVSFAVFDAYGNPATERTSSTLRLTDSSGSVSPTSVTLDSNGEAEATLQFTTAFEDNRIYGWWGGVQIGRSTRFDITAGAVTNLAAEPEATWVWVGEATKVTVRAEDEYGNACPSYLGSVTLSSRDGLGSDVDVGTLSGGEAVVEFTWSDAGLQDRLEVGDGTLSAYSTAVDALDPDCSNGPTARLRIAGSSTAVLCSTSGSTPSTTVSAAASLAGANAIAAYHFDLGEGDWVRSTAASKATTWSDPALYPLEVVVADSAACGDEAKAKVYVGDTLGEPAGPVEIEIVDPALSAATDETTVNVAAQDCSGDVARYGTLYLRADLGDLEDDGSSTFSSTGEGLALALDSNGEGSLTWSMASEDHGGATTIYAGVLTGAAWGAGSAVVTGEVARPTVLSVDPSGQTSELFDTMHVEFSEAMNTRSFKAANFSLEDPDGELVSMADTTFAAASDGASVDLQLPDILDGASGAWTFTITTGVSDDNGNTLDGGYTGSAGTFTLQFGDTSDSSVPVASCTASSESFRPDGDDGSDEEADDVEFAVAGSRTPEWWLIEVEDADGGAVWTTRVAATSSSETLTWDGRDQSGLVVDNGTYTVAFTGQDAYWNSDTPCSVSVAVDNTVSQ